MCHVETSADLARLGLFVTWASDSLQCQLSIAETLVMIIASI